MDLFPFLRTGDPLCPTTTKEYAMTYVISDIHGCYREYAELLDKLRLSPEDTLYILGDAMDRGPAPIKVIQDIMARPNAWYILGNHDFMMWSALRRLAVEVTQENIDQLTADAMLAYCGWMENGGGVTAEQFRKLPRDEQNDILEFLEEASAYEIVKTGGTRYVLTHAGITGFDARKSLDEYDLEDFLWDRPDYETPLFPDPDTFLVTGHTPTPLIHGEPLVYRKNGHIAVDCGCVFGGALAAYCFETGETVYVPSKTGKAISNSSGTVEPT